MHQIIWRRWKQTKRTSAMIQNAWNSSRMHEGGTTKHTSSIISLIYTLLFYNIPHASKLIQNNFPLTSIHTGWRRILSIDEWPLHARWKSSESVGVFALVRTSGQDRAFQFWGVLANYIANNNMYWFTPLLGGTSPTSSTLILKMNMSYNGVSRELDKLTWWRGKWISYPLPEA
jgi:hypothetical protein